MTLTAEHKAKMREGRERWEEEQARQKAERQAVYSAWVHEDAQLFAAYVTAEGPERRAARAAWVESQRTMPPLP